MNSSALALLEHHVRTIAAQCGQRPEFVWRELNYCSLQLHLEAALAEDAGCIGCGHPFANQLDVEIAYREPPRDHQDYARLHAENAFLLCTACARRKAGKSYDIWLDDMWRLDQAEKAQAVQNAPKTAEKIAPG